MAKMTALCKRLGYTFNDIAYLELALTHRSAGKCNYERIEFLGDSIVNFIIGDALFRQFPYAWEGELSRLRARMIQGKMLASLAREFKLGEHLRLGSFEILRESIMADAMEAVIGAIYLDGGVYEVRECILRWYRNRLSSKTDKDHKTKLQELIQSLQQSLPCYEILTVDGEAHKPVFTVRCYVEGEATTGIGYSRSSAEQEAAERALGGMKK